MILVDTSIWSLSLRRKPEQLNEDERIVVGECTRLVRSGEATITWAVRQELLMGIRNESAFAALQDQLNQLPEVPLQKADYDRAAFFYNQLKRVGVSAGDVDALICAVAFRASLPIFTLDRDFTRYAEFLPINLHSLT